MKIALMVLFLALGVCAGDKIGNGGDVLVCPGESATLLDLHQGLTNWGLPPLTRSGRRSDIIRAVLAPLISIDPKIGLRILDRSLAIDQELGELERGARESGLVRFTSQQLVNIADEGVAEIPPGCEITQAASQVQVPFPAEKKFTFQKTTWELADEETQAALILHETIYEFFISVNEPSSRSTRYFNASLHAGVLTSAAAYLEISGLYGYRTLDIAVGEVRAFNKCVIRRYRRGTGNGRIGEMTSISVRNRSIVTESEDYYEAMELLRREYASRGLCD